ncbi:MAG: hypothetical protein HY735_37465 [Verrucomicrobia bacterium]|nr:hypothetical protein [Verrucomicrobiota bacterium]
MKRASGLSIDAAPVPSGEFPDAGVWTFSWTAMVQIQEQLNPVFRIEAQA